MQRFTIKLSQYQKGKKLGFVLVDSFIGPGESYSEDDGEKEDEGVSNIRGGGGEGTPNTPVGHKTSTLELLNQLNKGGSLHSNFAKEAAEAEAAIAQAAAETVQAAVGTEQPTDDTVQPSEVAEDAPPQDTTVVEGEEEAVPQGRKTRSSHPSQTTQATTRTSKRKRQTQISISPNSSVFKFAEQLAELSKEQSDTLSFDPSDFRYVDKLIEWGTKEGNIPPFQTRSNGLLPLGEVNTEAMKFVISGTIKGGDLVEKVQYTKVGVPVKRLIPNKTLRESSAQSYYRSDYYNTFQCENKQAMDLANVLRVEENYPLYVTFKRSSPEEVDVDESGDDTCEPPRKRTRRSESTNAKATVKNKQVAPKKDEVIELLDSSDEEDAQVPQVSMEIDSTTDAPPSIPPPDPALTQSFYDDDFVLTPYGAGKILSSRVERYASSDIDSEATIYKPSIIYTIDLHFGICHVPASQVKSIQGTTYTEKTIFTYQRAPLTAHDLLRLRPMTYLNDSIVNFYLKYLRTQYDENSKLCKEVTNGRGWDDLDGEGIHVFPTFAYTRIKNCMPSSSSRTSKAVRNKIWKELKTWTKSVDIFKKKLLIFPINEHLHWTCVFVCHPGRLVRRHAKDVKEVVKKMVKDENSKPQPDTEVKPVVVEGKSILKKEAMSDDLLDDGIVIRTPSQNKSASAQGPTTSRELGVEDTLLYMDQVKIEFGDRPHIYNGFLEIMKNFKAQEVDTIGVINRVRRLFHGHNNMILGFNTFIPDGYDIEIKDGDDVDADQSKPSNEETKADDAADPVVMNEKSLTEEQRAEVKAATSNLKGELASLMKVVQPPKNGMYRPLACRKRDEEKAKAEAIKADIKSKFDKVVKEDEVKPPKVTNREETRTKDNKEEAKPSDVESSTDIKPEEKTASSSTPPEKPKYRTKWQCDFCGKEAEFYDFDEACEHEKICGKNIDWCLIHFDSGKHFKLHKTTEITGNIRKYLNAYYEAEYSSTHPKPLTITTKNMPSFTAAGLPQQDNTKDCGVYMLENAERMLSHCPVIDYNFVNKTKGETKQKFFGCNDYTKSDIEKKRDDIHTLVETLRRVKD